MNKREKYDSTGIASSIFDNKKETNNAAYQREKYDSTGIVSSIYDNKKEIKNSKLDYDDDDKKHEKSNPNPDDSKNKNFTSYATKGFKKSLAILKNRKSNSNVVTKKGYTSEKFNAINPGFKRSLAILKNRNINSNDVTKTGYTTEKINTINPEYITNNNDTISKNSTNDGNQKFGFGEAKSNQINIQELQKSRKRIFRNTGTKQNHDGNKIDWSNQNQIRNDKKEIIVTKKSEENPKPKAFTNSKSKKKIITGYAAAAVTGKNRKKSIKYSTNNKPKILNLSAENIKETSNDDKSGTKIEEIEKSKLHHEATPEEKVDKNVINHCPKREKYDSTGIASRIYDDKNEIKNSDLDDNDEKLEKLHVNPDSRIPSFLVREKCDFYYIFCWVYVYIYKMLCVYLLCYCICI